MRKISDYLVITLKGVAMGAADVIPGVSGGTIAFISGIYSELLESISSIDLTALKLFFSGKFGAFWRHVNGGFLLALVSGVALSVFSLAKAVTWFFTNYPVPTWAFFFGLIAASSVYVARGIGRWNAVSIISLVLGAAAAWLVTSLTPTSTPDVWWFIIFSGAIAICALILPGISGAFILLLLGKYHFIMNAIGELEVGTLLLFGIGAAAGLLSFARLLNTLLSRYRLATLAALTGFMVGSLNKVWPWKKCVDCYIDSDGVVRPLVERNITPGEYALTGDPMVYQAAAWFLAGLAIIFIIEYIAGVVSAKNAA